MISKNMNGVKEIVLPEDFSVELVAEFRKSVNALIDGGSINFILNFEKCNFVDSTGLGVIIATYKKCMELGGTIILKSIKPQVMKIFTLTRLDKVFEIIN